MTRGSPGEFNYKMYLGARCIATNMNNKYSFIWLALGLGSQLQVVASLSISEILVLLIAPVLFVKTRSDMRRDGIMPFLLISLAQILGCVVSILANHTPTQMALRGLAVVGLLPCVIVVSHWLLRFNPAGFKWYLLGVALSGIICIFVFQKSVEVTMLAGGQAGDRAVDEIVSGPIFWISRLNPFVLLATNGWYLHTPIVLDIAAGLFMTVFAAFTSVSGRSAAVVSLGFVAFLVIGGKRPGTMRKIGKHFCLLAVVAIVSVFCLKEIYSFSAATGLLGEDAQRKYETQTKGDKGLMALLLGGRMGSFCGLLACLDKPIVGWGPWAEDTNGYVESFLQRYGTYEDYVGYINTQAFYAKSGVESRGLIPCHSMFTQFWLWYGAFGLVFVLYSLFVIFRYIKQDCWAVPQWYAWLACASPAVLWSLFFSPFSDRLGFPMFIVACLMARAVRRGTFRLPFKMVVEMGRRGR